MAQQFAQRPLQRFHPLARGIALNQNEAVVALQIGDPSKRGLLATVRTGMLAVVVRVARIESEGAARALPKLRALFLWR